MKLLFDFGLVVLIWIVQLIVYPSFAYFDSKNLLIWHQKYTLLITIIVLPLMLGQLSMHAYSTLQQTSLLNIILLILVLSTWLITFIWAVPLHSKIDKGIDLPSVINQLVAVNWPRTIIWSLIFLIGLINSIKNSEIAG